MSSSNVYGNDYNEVNYINKIDDTRYKHIDERDINREQSSRNERVFNHSQKIEFNNISSMNKEYNLTFQNKTKD